MRSETSPGRDHIAGPVMLIVVGGIFLAGQFVPGLSFDKLWPLIPIAAGAAMLLTRR